MNVLPYSRKPPNEYIRDDGIKNYNLSSIIIIIDLGKVLSLDPKASRYSLRKNMIFT